MSTFQRIALGVLVASLAASVVASMLVSARVALLCGAPALVMSVWAAIGHLVTIDDDFAGGWSNPDGSSQIWYQSLRELAIKLVVALFVAWLVVGAPLAQDAA
jgi:hypothetical protein